MTSANDHDHVALQCYSHVSSFMLLYILTEKKKAFKKERLSVSDTYYSPATQVPQKNHARRCHALTLFSLKYIVL
jgi:hypothetical protein